MLLVYAGHHSSERKRDPQDFSDKRSLQDKASTHNAAQALKEGAMGDTDARSTFVRDFYAKSDRCRVHRYIFASQRCILTWSKCSSHT